MKKNLLILSTFTLLIIAYLSSCKQDQSSALLTIEEDQSKIESLVYQNVGNYQIAIPEDYKIVHFEGPEFDVYYVEPLDSSLLGKFSAGLYFGNFPSYFEASSDSCYVNTMNASILGKLETWTYYDCSKKHSVQCIVSLVDDLESFSLHAFGNADNVDDISQIFTIFSTLKEGNI